MSESKSLRCSWEVTAGVVPGTPEPEFTKRFYMLSEEYQSQYSAEIFTCRRTEAVHYAEQLHNPKRFNWVRLDWIWY